jgi:N-acetylneuraminate synthase/N,N'-diacetyllegionaminate synthase
MTVENTIKIDNRTIGGSNPCFIIAEAGSNHDGDFKKAKRLIDIAVQAGADAIKFQSFLAKNIVLPTDPDYKLLKSIELPFRLLKSLKDYAVKRKIIFSSTAFDLEGVDRLDKLGVPFFKIASGDITYKQMLEYVAKKGKPIFLSTGKSDLKDIDLALKWLNFRQKRNVILLHCVSQYPALPSELNLKTIKALKSIYNIPIGFSDHSKSIYLPSVAVAQGAVVIEKHFTYNKKAKGPDHHYALSAKELKLMVKIIKDTEIAMGDGLKKPCPRERDQLLTGRRGLYAARSIKKGTKLTSDKILVVRPQLGMPAYRLEEYIGRIVNKNIKKYSPIMDKYFK